MFVWRLPGSQTEEFFGNSRRDNINFVFLLFFFFFFNFSSRFQGTVVGGRGEKPCEYCVHRGFVAILGNHRLRKQTV